MRGEGGGGNFRLINVQAMSETKQLDIMRQFFENEKEHNLMCLTETRQKTNTIAIPDSFYRFTAMRQDKKASKRGGLQILGIKNKSVDWRQIETGNNKDLLVIEGKCFNIKLRIILVYFDVNKRLETKQAGENVKLRSEVERAMRENRMEGMLILGDMNGHLKIKTLLVFHLYLLS